MAETAFRIFDQSRDDAVRQACLETLHQVNTTAARKKLQQIAQDTTLAPVWRTLSASFLGAGDLKPSEIDSRDAGASLRAAADD
jgi:hypothetical protein